MDAVPYMAMAESRTSVFSESVDENIAYNEPTLRERECANEATVHDAGAIQAAQVKKKKALALLKEDLKSRAEYAAHIFASSATWSTGHIQTIEAVSIAAAG